MHFCMCARRARAPVSVCHTAPDLHTYASHALPALPQPGNRVTPLCVRDAENESRESASPPTRHMHPTLHTQFTEVTQIKIKVYGTQRSARAPPCGSTTPYPRDPARRGAPWPPSPDATRRPPPLLPLTPPLLRAHLLLY